MEIERNDKSIIKPHPRKIIAEAEKIQNLVNTNLFIDEAPKRKLIEWITIDWAWTRDLDDWVWAEKTNFWYSLFISISDTSEFIKPDSKIDLYTKNRPTSIYLSTHVYNMVPKILSTWILSLNHEEKTLTQTLEVNFDNNFNIINHNSFESIFYNKHRLNYQTFNENFNNPDSEIYNNLKILEKISKALKQKRIKWWANPFFRECISLKFNKDCEKNTQNIGQEIIAEIAILKNMIDAVEAYKTKLPIIYRWFKPELRNKILWNIKSNNWFFNYKPTYHSWFKTLFYTYNTSPIRRYSDLINQRQFKSQIREKLWLYNQTQIRNFAFHINTRLEDILLSQKTHNEEVIIKRSERLISKLEKDNYENIWSLPKWAFHYLLKYFIKYENKYLSNPQIINEIIYRINNNLLNKKTLSLLKSAPNNINEIQLFKEIIKNNQQENFIY